MNVPTAMINLTEDSRNLLFVSKWVLVKAFRYDNNYKLAFKILGDNEWHYVESELREFNEVKEKAENLILRITDIVAQRPAAPYLT